MVETGDHLLDVFRQRDNPAVREAYVLEKEREAAERRAQKRKANKRPARARTKKRTDLFRLEMPESIQAGRPVTVKLRHTLENSLGEQLVHVTLKAGLAAKRVDRKVVRDR